jgi:hypothetical protein
VHIRSVGHDREVVAVAAQRGLAQRERRRPLLRKELLDPGIAVERDVLVVEDRVRIGDGRGEQRTRVGRGRGDDDLRPGVR